jgi:hypothetical protein
MGGIARILACVFLVSMFAAPAGAAECPQLVQLEDLVNRDDTYWLDVDRNGDVYVVRAEYGWEQLYRFNYAGQRTMIDHIIAENAFSVGPDPDSNKMYLGIRFCHRSWCQGEVAVYDKDNWWYSLYSLGTGWGEFRSPSSIKVDDGLAYVKDGGNIKIYNGTDGSFVDSFGGVPGHYIEIVKEDLTATPPITEDRIYGDCNAYAKDGTHLFQFDEPCGTLGYYGFRGMAVDNKNRIVYNYGGLHIFDSDGTFICSHPLGGTNEIAITPDNRLYMGSSWGVLMFGLGDYVWLGVDTDQLSYSFGPCSENQLEKSITISNKGPGVLKWNLSTQNQWIIPSATSGEISGEGSVNVAITVDPEGLYPGVNYGYLMLTAQGAEQGITVNVTVDEDTTPPATSAVIDGTVVAPGWYAPPVTATLTSTDDCTGVKEIHYTIDGAETVVPGESASFAVTDNGAHDVTYWAVDNSLNSEAAKPLDIDIDTVPPTTSHIVNGTTGDNEWYVSDVDVTLTATDEGSGVGEVHYTINSGADTAVPGATATFTLADNGANTVSYWSKDNALNSEAASSPLDISIDTVQPTTSHFVNGTMGDNEWYVSNVDVTLTASDETSGVREIHYIIDDGEETVVPGESAFFTITEDGEHTVTFWAVDNAGNKEPVAPIPVKKDASPPDTDPVVPPPPPGGYYDDCVTVELRTTEGSSGVLYTEYRLPGEDWEEYTGQFVVCNEGTTTVEYRSKSNAGIVEPAEPLLIDIDTAPPTTSHSVNGTMGDNEWYVSVVDVTLTATDVTSGVSEIQYILDGTTNTIFNSTAAFSVSENGPHAVTYRATDVAGNGEAEKGPVSFKIDTVPPVIIINGVADGETYELGVVPVAGYTASDQTSGVDENRTTETFDGGEPYGLGSITYSVTAYDNAGIDAAESVTYTVVGGVSGLQALVNQYEASGDIYDPDLAQKLRDDLSEAEAYIAQNDRDKAIQALEQFKHQVDQGRDKGDIAPNAAQVMLAAANSAISRL